MSFNLQHYKNVLFYKLLFDKDILSLNHFVCAKSIGASVSGYLGHSPDMKNETEKEIYQYARRLMNDVLVNRIEFNQLLEQMASELGINKNIIKNEVNVSDPLIKALINDDYRQFQELVKNHKRDDSVYNRNMDIEVHDWMNNIDIFNAFLRRLKNGYSLSQRDLDNGYYLSQTDYAYNIASCTADYLNSERKLSLDEQEEIYHISQQLVQDLLIKQYPLELVTDYVGYNITPLTRTMIDGNYEEFKKELVSRAKRGLNFLDGHNKPLEWAILAQPNDMRYLQDLITMGADVNDASAHQTPLTVACCEDNIEAVKLLVDAGADINKEGLYFELPLMLTKKTEIVDFLIKSGADVNKRSSEFGTPLMQACRRGDNIKIIQQLINAGADINVGGFDLKPLDFLVYPENIQAIELLFKSGAKSTSYFERKLEENKEKWGSHYNQIKKWIAVSNKKKIKTNKVNLTSQTQQQGKKDSRTDNERKSTLRNIFLGGRG